MRSYVCSTYLQKHEICEIYCLITWKKVKKTEIQNFLWLRQFQCLLHRPCLSMIIIMYIKTISDGPDVYWRVPMIIYQIFFFFSDCPNVYWIGGSPGLYIKSVSARRGLGKGIDVQGWKSCRRFSLELEDYGTNTAVSDLPIAIGQNFNF